jgi:hypothetical protein
VDSLASDVTELVWGLNADARVEFRRIVVTPEQIETYGLPSAPQKGTDRRGDYMDETVQAEALPPDVLATEIRNAIEEVIDQDQLQEMTELGDTERDRILGVIGQLDEL